MWEDRRRTVCVIVRENAKNVLYMNPNQYIRVSRLAVRLDLRTFQWTLKHYATWNPT